MTHDDAVSRLVVSELSVGFPVGEEVVLAADRVSFEVAPGEVLGLVGESGCGKSVSLRALLGLVQKPGAVLGGQAWLDGKNLLQMSSREIVEVRGSRIAMIFQDPASSLNPVLAIGNQLSELLRLKAGLSARAAKARAVELLTRVGIPSARERMKDFPHQLSGGMRQRVMIAMAVACKPRFLFADEPTTALDVTVQDQILALIDELREEFGMGVVLVSHDLGVIGQMCDNLAVMYAGRIIESGSIQDVLDSPRHPYTAALMRAVPDVDAGLAREPLQAIGGQPPDLTSLPPGCSFASRCPHALPKCEAASMDLDRPIPLHGSGCIRADELVEHHALEAAL
jgi:peptide/nickel transport system ATP-binding protein